MSISYSGRVNMGILSRAFAAAAIAGAFASADAAMAQGTFTLGDGNRSFTLFSLGSATSDGPLCNLASTAIDHLVQNHWWIGEGLNRTREFALDAASVTSEGNTGPRSFQRTFDLGTTIVRVDYEIAAVGAAGVTLTQTVTVRNTAFNPITIDLFNIVDTDISATAAADNASGPEHPETFVIRDTVTNAVARMFAPGHIGFQGGGAPTVRSRVTDADLDVFINSGLPFSGADCSLGVQWRFVNIGRGQSRSCSVVFSIGVAEASVPTGACSLANNNCEFTTAHDCDVRNGTYLGDGTHCPNPFCPCDWNNSGALNSQDFFDFLVDFFREAADYNFDSVTNSQDYFDYIVWFFTAPNTCIP